MPEEEYEMRHDVYSLGVCLLEVGLGTSFVSFEATWEEVCERTSALAIR